MAPRPFWKGYLKLSLVTCPVSMMPATTESERVRFHTLNRRTGHRIRSQYVDAGTERVVDEENIVKGYETGEGAAVLLEDDELDAIALESTRTIDIDTFVPRETIEWIWYDKPHFLLPEEEVAAEAYAVIRDAMAATKTVAISRLVLYRRERAVMLQPRDRGIILWTLRYGDDVRDETDYFPKSASGKSASESKLLSLVKKLIDERTKPWRPSMVSDPIQDKLLDLIEAKKKRARKSPAKPAKKQAAPSNVVNIADALRRSLAAEGKRSRKADG